MVGFLKSIPASGGIKGKCIWFVCCTLVLVVGSWFGYTVWAYTKNPDNYHLSQGTIIPLFWGTAAVGFSFSGLIGIYLGLLPQRQASLTRRKRRSFSTNRDDV